LCYIFEFDLNTLVLEPQRSKSSIYLELEFAGCLIGTIVNKQHKLSYYE